MHLGAIGAGAGGLEPLPAANQNNLGDIRAAIDQLFIDIGNYQQAGAQAGQARMLELSNTVITLSNQIAGGVRCSCAQTDELVALQAYLNSSRFKVLPEESYEKKVHQQLVYASKNIFLPIIECALPSTRCTHHLSKILGPTWVKLAQLALIASGVVGYLYLDEKSDRNDGKKHVESTATFMAAMAAAGVFYLASAGISLYKACKLNPGDNG